MLDRAVLYGGAILGGNDRFPSSPQGSSDPGGTKGGVVFSV